MQLAEFQKEIDYSPIHKKLTLYHGSRTGIKGPIQHDYAKARDTCDFGKGFYLGTDPDQAKSLICTAPHPVLYKADLDLNGLRCVKIEGLAWAMLIAYHRGKLALNKNARLFEVISKIDERQDVIIGTIADDQIYRVLPEFFDNAITDQALLACLRRFKLGTQYVLKSQKACEHVEIISEQPLTEDELVRIRKEREEGRQDKDRITDETKAKFLRTGLFFSEAMDRLGKNIQEIQDSFSTFPGR